MSNFRKFISVAAVAMLGVTNLLTPLSYANAADVNDYDGKSNPISTAKSFSFLMPAHHVYLYATTEANKYFVEYHGGTGASWEMWTGTFTYDSHSWHLAPNEFVKTWYTWSSWNTWADGQGTTYPAEAEVFNWTTVESGTEHVYAQWSANRYSIDYTLNDSGTSQAVHPQTPTWAAFDELIEIVNPTRTWYSFSGWDITNMGTDSSHTVGWQEGVVGDTATEVTGTGYKNLRATEGTVHFAARWRAENVEYTVNHFQEKLEGWYPETPTDVVTGSATADEYKTWATTTYEWFTTPEKESKIIDANGTTVFNYYYVRNSYDLELIPGRWIVSVTVDADNSSGGTNTTTHNYSIKYGDTATLSYVVEDWYTGAAWSGGTAPVFTMPATGQVREAYAVPIEYKITVNTNWGTGTYPTGYNKETTPAIDFDDPDGTNSDFLWWIGTDIEWISGDVIIPTGSTWDRTYTAQWKCHTWYHASNSTNTGDISYGDCIANTDTTYTIHYEKENLSWGYSNYKDGTWVGTTNESTNGRNYANEEEWFTVSSVTTWEHIAWDGSTEITIRYDRNNYHETIIDGTGITTTAVWAYDSNADGSGQHQYWDTVTLSQTTKSGYTFNHWEVEDASWNHVELNGNTFIMPASDVTIRSYSTTDEFDLHIIKNWGTGGSDDRTYTVEDTITLVKPSRDHSTFVWWSWTNITGDPDPTVSFSWRAYDSTYEAVWDCVTWYTESDDGQKCEANPYTVIIDYNDDDHPDNVNKPFIYDATGTIENPSKSWYDFAWWTVSWASDTATVDGQPLGEGPTSGTEFKNLTTTSGWTVTLTATWTPKTTTEYKVYHYTKNLGSGYTLADSGVFQWTSDAQLTVAKLAKEFTGFGSGVGYTGWTVNGPDWSSVTTVTIDRHGTTEIHIYYDRSEYHVYLSGDAHVIDLIGEGDYSYDSEVTVEAVVQSWYHFKHWEKRWSGFVALP